MRFHVVTLLNIGVDIRLAWLILQLLVMLFVVIERMLNLHERPGDMSRYKFLTLVVTLTLGVPLLTFVLLAIGLYLGLWGVRV